MNLRNNIEKSIPLIKKPIMKNIIFNKWIKISNMYSILILDISGSMRKYYDSLINMTNNIIEKQKNNEENEGVIIFFGTKAKAIINGKFRLLDRNEIVLSNPGIRTNFLAVFKEAEKFIYHKNNFKSKRILFLTDGKDDSS